MADKEQTPPMQVPEEANNYKHIDAPSSKDAEGGDEQHNDEAKGGQPTNKAANSNSDFCSDIMQTENDIDPGNEHRHQLDNDSKSIPGSDADDDGRGTAGS